MKDKMERVFQECVMEVKLAGKSVLLSSHILSEVEKLCDRVGIIRQGTIIETGTLKELRHLTRTQIILETKEPILHLKEVKGIHNVEREGDGYIFQVDTSEMDEVLKYVAAFGISKLESSPPTLEDLFMQHYEGKTKGGNQ